jgi:hypothetical protein
MAGMPTSPPANAVKPLVGGDKGMQELYST